MNEKTLSLIDRHFIMKLSIILSILFTPFFTYAGTFYLCIDKNGNKIISDHPLPEGACKPQSSFEDMSDEELNHYKKEKEDIEKKDANEEKMEEIRKTLNECYRLASERYRANWDDNCRLQNRNPDCALPVEIGNVCNDIHQQEKNRCLKEFKEMSKRHGFKEKQ